MANGVSQKPKYVAPTAIISKDKNAIRSLINKFLYFVRKYGMIGFVAAITAAISFFLWQRSNYPKPIISSKTDLVADSVLVMGKKVSVAHVQASYTKAFKHLKRMEVYYREARDLILDFHYADVVKKCDSALLYKIEKPLNWSPQKWGDVYNLQAESLLYLGENDRAEAAAILALKMDKQDKLGYLHLIYAQILANKHKKTTPLFLENFTYALKKQLPLWDYMELDGFEAVKNDPLVKRLLKQYQVGAFKD